MNPHYNIKIPKLNQLNANQEDEHEYCENLPVWH